MTGEAKERRAPQRSGHTNDMKSKKQDRKRTTAFHPDDEGGHRVPGPVLRFLVGRSGDLAIDVISVPEHVVEERFGGTEDFIFSLYKHCEVDWWTAAPVKGVPVRVMRFGEDEDPERFLVKHHDDRRRFI